MDQSTRTSLYELIAEIRMTSQIPMLMVTHNLEEARLLADQLLVMDEGVGLQHGDPRSITLKPRNARVADIVGIQNRYKGVFLRPLSMAWPSCSGDCMQTTHACRSPTRAAFVIREKWTGLCQPRPFV